MRPRASASVPPGGVLLLALALLLVSGASPSRGALLFSPSIEWRTIETPHFDIHFAREIRPVAERLANIAEEVHRRLAPVLRWEPFERTQVLLIDTMDFANGLATPIPYNTVALLVTPPAPADSLMNVDDWLRLGFTHEYTHILHLDQASGFSHLLRYVFGRAYFPNLFLPDWVIEGLAAFDETEFTSAGRGRATYTKMVVRAAALEGKLPTVDRGDGPLGNWPDGEYQYLFGVSFLEYLAHTRGLGRVAGLAGAYGGRFPPYVYFNRAGQEALGADFYALWGEWRANALQEARDAARTLEALGLTPARRLTTTGFRTRGPRFLADGRLLFSRETAYDYPRLALLDPATLRDRTVALRNSGWDAAVAPDGRWAVFSQIEIEGGFFLRSDLYRADLAGGATRRLTEGLRASDPDLSADGATVVAAVHARGQSSLVLVPSEGSAPPRTLLEGKGFEQFYTPRWSPDGGRIAFTLWSPGGFYDLAVVDADGGGLRRITQDRAADLAPTWSPDGRYVVFSSDRNGTFDLYAYSVTEDRTFQVTRLLGGAFESAVSPDGKRVVFAGYSAEGFDLYEAPFDPSTWKEAPVRPREEPEVYAPASLEYPEAAPATRLRGLLPRLWTPGLYYDPLTGTYLSANTLGADVLLHHLYRLSVSYQDAVHAGGGRLQYWNNQLYPTFALSARDEPYPPFQFTDDTGSHVLWERDREAALDMFWPVNRVRWQLRPFVGASDLDIQPITGLPAYILDPRVNPDPGRGTLASLRTGLVWNDAREFGLSVSPEDGRVVRLLGEAFDPSWGSRYRLQRVYGDWREYLSLPPVAMGGKRFNHVLALEAQGGIAWGNAPARTQFRVGGNGEESIVFGGGALALPGPPAEVSIPASTDLLGSVPDPSAAPLRLRGYPSVPTRGFIGTHAVAGGVEYRFPLWVAERGLGTLPVFLEQAHAAIFADAGAAWTEALPAWNHFGLGVGAEIKTSWTVGYLAPLTLLVGTARGLTAGGGTVWYLAFGLSF